MERPTAFSLFTGAGGLDLGVERAGFRTVFAVENDPVAVRTLNANRAAHFPDLAEVQPLDITSLDPREVMRELGLRRGELDFLVGGPPCVAFSKSGFHLEYKRQGRDPKANLLEEYLRFLDALRPAAFLMENVFGLAYKNQSAPAFDRLAAGIRRLGYSLSCEVLNAADYGVPQNRQRLFLIGSRDGRDLGHPRATHWGEHERRARPVHADRLLPHVTAGEALKGLRTRPEPADAVKGSYGHLLRHIPPGGNYLHFTKERGHRRPLFRWRSRYWTFLLKADPQRPISTIQGQPGPYVGPFHWRNRRLRVPELKRLQGFPDDFQLAGTRGQVQLQVGNSVPPLLAFVIARSIRAQLEGEVAPGQISLAL